eukprot:TRINITY_DN341_c0_g2_i3.p1 TRINITY_DN341_c0_g2~~TRINITY_DN341_c0_g2_i3.p1  ORF type:complete len:817 (+),score=280.73 TRINITY_DN341_c0_g2_i3:2550-5000(+)
MNYILYQGRNIDREMIRQYEWHFQDDRGNPIMKEHYKFNVVLTSYELILASDWNELSKINWRAVIIDEAQRLKNYKSKFAEHIKTFKCEHRILLSGTPIQNNLDELWTLLNFIDPFRFASMSEFLREFSDLGNKETLDKLHQLLKPLLLRRLKEDVEKSIPTKEETIIEVELTTIQKRYYRAVLEKNRDFLNRGNMKSAFIKLANVLSQLRKVCNHPFLLPYAEERETAALKGEAYFERIVESSGKTVLLDKLLPKLKANHHRILIFSQMVKTLDLLEKYLQYRAYPYERFDGTMKAVERQAAIDRFCKPESDRFVFLLSTRAGGVGLNLAVADTVVIFDSDWNPQMDLQAQARAHRIGQKKEVKVYRLITRNTCEFNLFEQASKKLGLDQVVLDGVSKESKRIETKELNDLLKKGVYSVLQNNDEEIAKFCAEDIDQILEARTTKVTYNSVKGEGNSNTSGMNFSKAFFQSKETDSEIDINAENFWELALPGTLIKTPERLVEQLRGEKSTFEDDEDRDAFFEDVSQLVQEKMIEWKETKMGFDINPIILLLETCQHADFTSQQFDQINEWLGSIRAPRRKRASTVQLKSIKTKDTKLEKKKKQKRKRRTSKRRIEDNESNDEKENDEEEDDDEEDDDRREEDYVDEKEKEKSSRRSKKSKDKKGQESEDEVENENDDDEEETKTKGSKRRRSSRKLPLSPKTTPKPTRTKRSTRELKTPSKGEDEATPSKRARRTSKRITSYLQPRDSEGDQNGESKEETKGEESISKDNNADNNNNDPAVDNMIEDRSNKEKEEEEEDIREQTIKEADQEDDD